MKVEGQEEVVVVASADADEDAAFLAEMKNEEVIGDEIIPDEKVILPQDGDVIDEPKAVVVEPAVVATPERKEVIAGFTEEEIRSALEQLPKLQKALDTTNGTMGSRLADQQRELAQLREQRHNTVGTLTTDKLKRLSKEFPELANLLAEDLNEFITQGQAQAPVDNSQIERVGSKVTELEKVIANMEVQREIKDLTRDHSDWRETAMFKRDAGNIVWNNPVFGKWVDAQPAETKDAILASEDASFLSKQLTKFKSETKPVAVKNKVIEDAIMPKGHGGKVVTDDTSDEEKAFREEMKRS